MGTGWSHFEIIYEKWPKQKKYFFARVKDN